MPNAKAIKTKIKSTENIKQITKALEIVATIKLQKNKNHTENFREFFRELLKIGYPLLDQLGQNRNPKSHKTLVILVSTDRGLCGGLNSRLFKKFLDQRDGHQNDCVVFCIGKKSLELARRLDFEIIGTLPSPDTLTEDAIAPLQALIRDAIRQQNFAHIDIFFNYFQSAMNQRPENLEIAPRKKSSLKKFSALLDIDVEELSGHLAPHNELALEPSRTTLLQKLEEDLIFYILYGTILMNKTGEFASRMIAMKNAKDNATDIIKKLQISYNKARQAAITQEVSEIMAAKMALGTE